MEINNKQGGKAIGSGGFGCLFDPVLKCKNKTRKNVKTGKMVSKLMLTKNAKREYNEIIKYKTGLQNIPNYEKYFLSFFKSLLTLFNFSPKRLDALLSNLLAYFSIFL